MMQNYCFNMIHDQRMVFHGTQRKEFKHRFQQISDKIKLYSEEITLYDKSILNIEFVRITRKTESDITNGNNLDQPLL